MLGTGEEEDYMAVNLHALEAAVLPAYGKKRPRREEEAGRARAEDAPPQVIPLGHGGKTRLQEGMAVPISSDNKVSPEGGPSRASGEGGEGCVRESQHAKVARADLVPPRGVCRASSYWRRWATDRRRAWGWGRPARAWWTRWPL